MQFKRVDFFLTQYLLPSNSPTPPSSVTPSNNLAPSSPQVPSNSVVPFQSIVSMLARMIIFLGLSFLAKPSCDSRTTFVRQSHDVRENIVRRSMVINVRNFIGRTSSECLANVARMSRECRETFANDSCDNSTTFVRLSQICLNHPFGVTAM